MPDIVQLKRAKASWWTANNPILEPGEPGIEKDTRKFKWGEEGVPWNDLEYASGGPSGGSDGEWEAELAAHIASLMPHPVLGDPDFDLVAYYRNVKAG